MKILTVNYELPPQGGGAGVVMFNLIDALGRGRRIKQTLLCGWDFRYGTAPVLSGVDLKLVPVTRKSIHSSGLRAVAEFLWRGGRALRKLDLSSYDIVHFNFSIPTGMLAAVIRNKPYVCSLHGIDVPGFVKEEAVLFQVFTAPINRQVLKRAARIFSPSYQIAEMVQRACPEARVEVIPHGIYSETYLPKGVYPTLARRFVTIARLTPWKRVMLLVKTVIELRKTITDVTLDIYGEGEQRPLIEELLRTSGATAYITLHGFTPKATLQMMLQTFDVFVLPSVSEAFGVVFLEAMAAGLPVIGYNYGGPAEVIKHGVNGILVDADNLPGLLAVLNQLATTPHLVEILGRNARREAVEKFSWQKISQRYYAVYEQVLAEMNKL